MTMNASIIKSELRFALRRLARNPLLSVTKFLILAIAIGCAASIFGVYNSFMLKALPYGGSESLVAVAQTDARRGAEFEGNVNYYSYEATKEQASTIRGISFHHWLNQKAQIGEASFVIFGVATSANFFEVLRPKLLLGTPYTEATAFQSSSRPVVLSHRFWIEEFNADPDVVGQGFVLNDKPHYIAGVAAPDFDPPVRPTHESIQIFVPIQKHEIVPEVLKSRWFPSVARLAEGATVNQLNSELANITQSVARDWPKVMLAKEIIARDLRTYMTRDYQEELDLLLAAAVLILAIAAINLVVLSLGQSAILARKQSIKDSLGGRWYHLVFSLFAENLVLSSLASVCGLYGGAVITKAIASQIQGLPVSITVADPSIILFSLMVGLCVTVVVTLSTWLYLSHHYRALGEAGGSTSPRVIGNRIGRTLVLGEITATALALVIVGLFVVSGLKRSSIPRQIAVDELYTFAVSSNVETHPSPLDRYHFSRRFLSELELIPGVESATLGPIAPLGEGTDYPFLDDLDSVPMDESARTIRRRSVTPNYFETLGLKILRGRGFEKADDVPGAPRTLVINQAAVDKYWPDSDPLGRKILINHRTDPEWAEVIGICQSAYSDGNNPERIPYAYRPTSTHLYARNWINVRMETPEATLSLKDVQQTINRVAPDTRISFFLSARDRLELSSWFSLTLTRLLITFALIIIALSAMGFLAFYYFKLSKGANEFALRIALGATTAQLRSMLLTRCLRDGLIGFALGSIGAFLIARKLQFYLYDTAPSSPGVYGFALLAVCLVTATGALYPILFFTKGNLIDPLKHDN